MSVVTLKYGSHRSYGDKDQGREGRGLPRGGWQGGTRGSVYLNLLILEDTVDAAVKGRAREHGGDGVREIQHRLQHRSHALGAR